MEDKIYKLSSSDTLNKLVVALTVLFRGRDVSMFGGKLMVKDGKCVSESIDCTSISINAFIEECAGLDDKYVADLSFRSELDYLFSR